MAQLLLGTNMVDQLVDRPFLKKLVGRKQVGLGFLEKSDSVVKSWSEKWSKGFKKRRSVEKKSVLYVWK